MNYPIETGMNIERGIISDWNEEKGFGFIAPSSGAKSIFFHIKDYSHRHKRPLKSLKVQFIRSTDPKGRLCAIDVVPLTGHKKNIRELKQKFISLIIFISFSAILYYLYKLKLVPLELIYLYAFMSAVAFLMYAKDKSAAEGGTWRTSESKLHTLALLGGWPGAAIAQSFLRHKSKKVSFRVTHWVMVIANCFCL